LPAIRAEPGCVEAVPSAATLRVARLKTPSTIVVTKLRAAT
jgi:hypothetical protein